jgi:hypothetical protein
MGQRLAIFEVDHSSSPVLKIAATFFDQLVAGFFAKPNLSGSRAGTGFWIGGAGSVKVPISGRDK